MENTRERQEKIKEIVDNLCSEMKSSYQVDNGLRGWHVEFWLDKETLESWASGELSQGSYTQYDDENYIHVCNINIENIRDCFADVDIESWEDMTDQEIDEMREASVADFDAPNFIDDILEWANKEPLEDNFDDNEEYYYAKETWEMEKPTMEEYWVC
jgi:hypothetical protein